MSGAIPPLPQDVFMAWCSVKKKKHWDNFTIWNKSAYFNYFSLHLSLEHLVRCDAMFEVSRR
jgi:hypothetical protein